MVDISAIAGALSSFKAANDIAQAMVGLRDAAAFNRKPDGGLCIFDLDGDQTAMAFRARYSRSGNLPR
jgi:hypothetical protein